RPAPRRTRRPPNPGGRRAAAVPDAVLVAPAVPAAVGGGRQAPGAAPGAVPSEVAAPRRGKAGAAVDARARRTDPVNGAARHAVGTSVPHALSATDPTTMCSPVP